MDEDVKGLGDYLAILGRRKKQLIWPALIILIISTAVAMLLPAIYRSEATILIEQQEIPSDLVRSTVTSYAGERIQIISQRVMTTENLKKIIEQYGLYKEDREDTSLNLLVDRMREDISLEMISANVVDPRSGRPTTATIAFKLSFSDHSPQLSQRVTNELVSLYLNENLKRRTQSAVETSGFLAAESEKLQELVADLETSLAEFKEKNINNLPELQQLNIQLMERAERELQDNDQRIRTLEERKIYLQSELAQLSPTSDLYASDGKRVLSSEDRLQALQSEYISAAARYSADHPDLIKMRREISALEQETGVVGDANEIRRRLKDLNAEMASLRKRYSKEHPDVKKLQRSIDTAEASLAQAKRSRPKPRRTSQVQRPDNPAYIQLQAQLSAAESELKSILQSREEIRVKIADFEERLMKSPQVEREYRTLTRDYENALAKYKEVKAKQLEAELAESLERESKGERFSLIEPPLLPEEPAKPNRLAIFFLGMVFSMAGGVGTVAVAESMSDSIKGSQGLIAVTGAPPLVVVPYIETEDNRKSKRNLRILMVIILLGLVAATAAAFHYFYYPLDVVWFIIQRKLGLDSGI